MSKKGEHIQLEGNPELSKNIFKVPEGYFNELHDKLMQAKEVEDTKLFQTEKLKELPFEVPDNYFNDLTESILDQTIGSETKVIPLAQQTWFKWSAIAATLLFIASFYFIRPTSQLTEENSLVNISNETIIEYLHTQESTQDDIYSDVDSFDLILEDMIADELDVFADILSTNSELNYHFEYYDY